MRPATLRTRLLLAAVYLLTVVVVALEVPLAVNLSRRATREFEAALQNDAVLTAARINDDVPLVGPDPASAAAPVTVIREFLDRAARTIPGTRFVVVDSSGRLLADSSNEAEVGTDFATPERPEFDRAFAVPGGRIDVAQRSSETLGEDLMLVTVPVVHQHLAIGAVRASEPMGALAGRVHRSWIGLGAVGLAVILAGMGLAWVLATSLARPVRRLEDAAVRLGRGDLEARAEPSGPAEVATLASSFNRMAGALASNFEAQRSFAANASHQLRTPLTGLRLRLEAITQEGGFAGEQAAAAEAEVDRLNELVEGLLQLAQASSAPSTGRAVELGSLARDAVERWAGTAAEAGTALRAEVRQRAFVWADPAELANVLDNLIENAIRYTPDGTEVVVETGSADGLALLAVRDSGPGIPEAERAHVFERFYRGTTGQQAGPGTGLGLAIVAEVARRWGGEVRLPDGPDGGFELLFPAASEPGRPTDRTSTAARGVS